MNVALFVISIVSALAAIGSAVYAKAQAGHAKDAAEAAKAGNAIAEAALSERRPSLKIEGFVFIAKTEPVVGWYVEAKATATSGASPFFAKLRVWSPDAGVGSVPIGDYIEYGSTPLVATFADGAAAKLVPENHTEFNRAVPDVGDRSMVRNAAVALLVNGHEWQATAETTIPHIGNPSVTIGAMDLDAKTVDRLQSIIEAHGVDLRWFAKDSVQWLERD